MFELLVLYIVACFLNIDIVRLHMLGRTEMFNTWFYTVVCQCLLAKKNLQSRILESL